MSTAQHSLFVTELMDSEEIIKVEWQQLPQRSSWEEKQKATNAIASKRNRNDLAKNQIQLAATPAASQAGGWEYLDHTADVQIHSWGKTLGEAFGAAVVGMFGYMVELEEIDGDLEISVVAEGHDLHSLLYNFMDECLYIFHTEHFVMKQLVLQKVDTIQFKVTAVAKGGIFDISRHSQGTEVKAITYSNMQIVTEDEEKVETFVIVDI